MAVARTSGLGSGKSGQGAAVDGGGSAAAVTTVGALLASGGLAWDSANGNEKSPKIRRQGGPSTAHVRGQRATPAGGASAVSPQRSSSFQRSVGHPGSTPALWVAADVGGTSAWRGGGDGGDRRRRPAVRYGGGVGQPGGAGRRWRPPATACPVAAEKRARSQQPSSGAAKMIQVGADDRHTWRRRWRLCWSAKRRRGGRWRQPLRPPPLARPLIPFGVEWTQRAGALDASPARPNALVDGRVAVHLRRLVTARDGSGRDPRSKNHPGKEERAAAVSGRGPSDLQAPSSVQKKLCKREIHSPATKCQRWIGSQDQPNGIINEQTPEFNEKNSAGRYMRPAALHDVARQWGRARRRVTI